MITHLHIENYALIEHLDIDLHTGFSVITGETGAGKSIILGAIGLLLGQRADTKSLKTGASRCVIEATFDLSHYDFKPFFDENDLDYESDECIVRRELTSAGKSRAFINDTPVQLTVLKELGEQLIDIHSQHKNLLLGKEDFQLNVLDILAQNQELLQQYRKQYLLYKELQRQLHDAIEAHRKSQDDEEYLRFQANQLAEANLVAGEQEEMEQELDTLQHAEEIKQAIYGANSMLQGMGEQADALQLVGQAKQLVDGISNVWTEGASLVERLESCYIELKDIADELSSADSSIDFDPERIAYISERLSTIYDLQKKHHVDTVEDLIDLQKDLEHRLLIIDNSDEFIADIEKQCNAQLEEVLNTAKQLSDKRREAATALEANMTEMLQPLGMPNVRFAVELQSDPSAPTPVGIDNVTFLFSANKASELQAVSKVASGGEIARVMLTLKSLIASAVNLPTIIFDEIDTGVSGSIAEKMARIMRDMGNKDRQVISITHLPQIAALGTAHYKVYKEDNEEATLSHIVQLTQDERIEEIAHMLSGETITEAALDNARSLLQNT